MYLTVKTDFYTPIAFIVFVLMLLLAMDCNATVVHTIPKGKTLTVAMHYNRRSDPML